eukprot:1530087-Prorocentrum_lima.AAC.1
MLRVEALAVSGWCCVESDASSVASEAASFDELIDGRISAFCARSWTSQEAKPRFDRALKARRRT